MKQNKINPVLFIEAMKASGEDNNAKLIASFFQSRGVEAHYVNPKDAGLFVTDEPGNAQVLPESYENLYRLRGRTGILVVPGFFGYNKAGDVLTFSRSGSDITGSILANGVKAELYENYTDVDAVYTVNPTIVEKPKEIRELTYREMRELSYAGFVFHDEALSPTFRAGIPVQVKNTNNPSAPGTKIVSQRQNTNGPVVGIASDDGFCNIYIGKYLMNKKIGFGRRLLKILEDFNLSFEHLPSGIYDISVILREKQMDEVTEKEVLERIQTELQADEVKITHHLALIMIVGEGMRRTVHINGPARPSRLETSRARRRSDPSRRRSAWPVADPPDRDDLVFSCLDHLDGLGSEIVEQVEPVLHEGAQGVLSMDRAMVIERTLGRPVVDVVRRVLEKCIQVATVEGRESIAGGLDVLLRHRPCSISRRSTAFHAKQDCWPQPTAVLGSHASRSAAP